MPVSEQTYVRVALEDPEGHWELVCGRLRRKPGMTMEHNDVGDTLAYLLHQQLDRRQFRVRSDSSRARTISGSYFIPDIFVVPNEYRERHRGRPNDLEAYADPLPFVAEIWSRSTGEYDVESKFPEYRARGDLEIWRVHPYEHTVTAWRKQADGSYSEHLHRDGTVEIASLPGVKVPLSELFDLPA